MLPFTFVLLANHTVPGAVKVNRLSLKRINAGLSHFTAGQEDKTTELGSQPCGHPFQSPVQHLYP